MEQAGEKIDGPLRTPTRNSDGNIQNDGLLTGSYENYISPMQGSLKALILVISVRLHLPLNNDNANRQSQLLAIPAHPVTAMGCIQHSCVVSPC